MQAYWLWALGALFAPAGLVAFSLLGLLRGSFLSTDFAAVLPTIALVISAGVLIAAAIARSGTACAIAAVGVVLTLGGYLWLHWIAGAP